MTRLILTADSSSAGGVVSARLADLAVPIELRMVWGPPRSDAELAAFLTARTSQPPDFHWLDSMPPPRLEKFGINELGLIEACAHCETVELWMETEPNAQLVLIWLLDYLGPQSKTLNIILRHVDASLVETEPMRLAGLKFPGVAINDHHLEIASLAWQAFRAPTPRAWFNLLSKDLSVLPQLRRCVWEMLEELPGRRTGLGASELRILELIAAGYVHPFEVFPHFKQRFQRRVYGYWKRARSWMALRSRRALLCQASRSGRSRWRCTMRLRVTRGIRKAVYRSPRSATTFWRAGRISAATIRLTAGGAART